MFTKITSNFENCSNLLMNLQNHDLDIILFTKITSNFENCPKMPYNDVNDEDNHGHIDDDDRDGDLMI